MHFEDPVDKVNFLILGAMKCGTSTMVKILKKHRDVCFSKPKETNFFSEVSDWKEHLSEYHKCFSQSGKLWGEASTSYTKPIGYNQSIWERIYEYNPSMKLIYIVRNPLDRIVSQYCHNYVRDRTSGRIDDGVLETSLLEVSMYHKQILPYINRFGIDQILILDFDDLLASKKQTTTKVLDFLKLESNDFPYKQIETIHANKSIRTDYASPLDKKPTLLPSTRKKIMSMLKNDIQLLEALLKKDLSKWMIESENRKTK